MDIISMKWPPVHVLACPSRELNTFALSSDQQFVVLNQVSQEKLELLKIIDYIYILNKLRV